MNAVVIIIVLLIVLFIFFLLNHVTFIKTNTSGANDIPSNFGYVQTQSNCSHVPGCCSLTKFGCCPDGVNSRTDIEGSNCPISYNPGYYPGQPGSVPNPPPPPNPAAAAPNPNIGLPPPNPNPGPPPINNPTTPNPVVPPPAAIPNPGPLPNNVIKPLRL